MIHPAKICSHTRVCRAVTQRHRVHCLLPHGEQGRNTGVRRHVLGLVGCIIINFKYYLALNIVKRCVRINCSHINPIGFLFAQVFKLMLDGVHPNIVSTTNRSYTALLSGSPVKSTLTRPAPEYVTMTTAHSRFLLPSLASASAKPAAMSLIVFASVWPSPPSIGNVASEYS